MKGVQCYELFGGIALKNHTFSFFISVNEELKTICSFLSVLFSREYIAIHMIITLINNDGCYHLALIIIRLSRLKLVQMKRLADLAENQKNDSLPCGQLLYKY